MELEFWIRGLQQAFGDERSGVERLNNVQEDAQRSFRGIDGLIRGNELLRSSGHLQSVRLANVAGCDRANRRRAGYWPFQLSSSHPLRLRSSEVTTIPRVGRGPAKPHRNRVTLDSTPFTRPVRNNHDDIVAIQDVDKLALIWRVVQGGRVSCVV